LPSQIHALCNAVDKVILGLEGGGGDGGGGG